MVDCGFPALGDGRPWDACVVGAGVGGLVAAACLAEAGRRVAVLEAGGAPGGYLASFRRWGATFDACVDSVGSVYDPDGSPGLLGLALEAAGVLREVEWVSLDPLRVQRFPAFDLVVRRGGDRLREALSELFPGCRRGLGSAVDRLAAIHARTRRAFGLPASVPAAAGFRDEPFGTFLSRFDLAPEAAAALGSYATFLSTGPAGVSTRAMADLWMSYVEGGAWRVAGGFGRLVDALVARVRASGGEVATACRALGAGRAPEGWRVATERGTVRARALVWAAAPPRGPGLRPLSPSFALLYAKARFVPVGLPASTGLFPRASLAFEAREGDPWSGAGGLSTALPAEGKDPPGARTLVLHWPVRPDAVRALGKDAVAEALGRLLARAAPDLTVDRVEAATPSTLARYTGNPDGAAYGWEQSAQCQGAPPPGDLWPAGAQRAGHWAGLGGGVLPAALTGWRAAKRILNGERGLWPPAEKDAHGPDR